MRGELKEAAVQQVFEPGARVDRGGHLYILKCIDGGWWRGYDRSGLVLSLCHETDAALSLRVVAPAPREGQRWLGGGYLVILGEGVVPASKGLWLLERGLRYDGDVSTAPPAPSPVASPEPHAPPVAPPAPWTLADARRLILDAIRTAAPRRPEAFTAALCSMAEFFVPGERLIRAASAALGAAEDRLPERGPIAPWQEELAARAARDVLESAFGRGKVPWLCVEACARYLDRRAGR